MKHGIALFAATVLLSCGLAAQTQPQERPERPEPPQMKTPEEIATMKADMMQQEVGLDSKQYKKVYKLFKKDQEYRQNAMESKMGGGMPPMGGPGGGPGMGGGMMGGPGMGGPGGGMMGGPGMGGNMGGGMPPQGGMQPGQRPEGAPEMRPGEDIVTDEYLEKQEKKLKKILTADQYAQWRAKHPMEHQELPPLELNAQ